ncbi:MAG TPA: glutamine-hydrolyzing carbamoyl-phosphate synthase small subunit [Acidobacteriota bacterium]
MVRAALALEDGSFFSGRGFGAPGTRGGEVVFCTGMTGYQEVLTDPSYKGQIVTLTYPEIGNYGIHLEDDEADRCYLEAFIVRSYCRFPSGTGRGAGPEAQPRSSLGDYLRARGVVAIEGVDTRALTLKLRQRGALRGVVSTEILDPPELIERARAIPSLVGRDLAAEVTCAAPYRFADGDAGEVVVVDFGVKRNILRSLAAQRFAVTVVPAATPAQAILSRRPAGVVISNGPGDPEPLALGIQTVRALVDSGVPLMGICLGHQLLGLALGGATSKLKFGHHGCNHPVARLHDDKVEITTQNHGFVVEPASLDPATVEITHKNLNDGTLEGLRLKRRPAFSVQYHPEAAPGPSDSAYLFDHFAEMVRRR